MKILLANDLAAPHGGAEILTLALRAGLRGRGHDARIFASSARSASGPSEADYACYGTTGRLRTLHRAANPSASLRLRRVLREFRPDVVHVRMFLTQLSPLILPLLRDVPALYHAAWYEAVCPTGHKLLPGGTICRQPAGRACLREGCLSLRAWPPLMAQRALLRRWRGVFDLVVANSGALRDELRADGFGPRVEVVWNGVPEVEPRPPLAGPPTITSAGRLGPEKGIDVLLRAFAGVIVALPEARLRIAGDGPERAHLERLAATLGVGGAVDFLGHQGAEQLEQSFRVGWVHAVPSRSPESFGLTAAEGMMRGTAVVATRAGGLAEIVVDGETGLLVPPGDAAALRDALLGLLSDRERAERLGRAGRARAKALLAREAWVDRFVDLYRELAASPAPSREPVTEAP